MAADVVCTNIFITSISIRRLVCLRHYHVSTAGIHELGTYHSLAEGQEERVDQSEGQGHWERSEVRVREAVTHDKYHGGCRVFQATRWMPII